MRRTLAAPGRALALFGAALAVIAVDHHVNELGTVSQSAGPILALALDGVPALTLVYAGYWLHGTEFSRQHKWLVVGWCALGAATFTSVTGASLAVRAFEGRVLTEPEFPLLLSATVGGQAGFVAGYLYVRALEDATRAQRANDALSFVNSVLRHDLRNTINVVRGNASLVASRADDEAVERRAATIREQTDEALDRIESTGEMVETLVGDSDLHAVDLADVADECADRVATAHEVTVETDLPESAPVVADDGLHSVVHNLLENAAEHNDAAAPRVEVGVEPDGDVTLLAVADNGPGFDDAADEDLGSVDGAGGLQLVDTLVDHYGGDAWVADDDAPGASVVVELPRAA